MPRRMSDKLTPVQEEFISTATYVQAKMERGGITRNDAVKWLVSHILVEQYKKGWCDPPRDVCLNPLVFEAMQWARIYAMNGWWCTD